ncbi:MAG: hypothetical protein IKN95_09325 [Lachnospiraceae bacterium]|nr:hypothetical protein [Lachnospiraceae bacterium]
MIVLRKTLKALFMLFIIILINLNLIKTYEGFAQTTNKNSVEFICNSSEGPKFDVTRGQKYGTSGFTVLNNKIYLIDTLDNSLIVRNNNETERFSLKETKYPVDILYYNDFFYILDVWDTECTVLTYDHNFNFVSKSNTGHIVPYCFTISDGVVTVVGEYKTLKLLNGSLVYEIDGVTTARKNDNIINISYQNNSWDIYADSDSFIKFITYYNDILFYERCKIVDGCSELIGEFSLEGVNTSGDLIYYLRIEKNEETIIPFSFFKIVNDEFYYLTESIEKVVLCNVKIDEIIDSKFEECINKANRVNLVEKLSRYCLRLMNTMYANVTRNQAFSRAQNIINTGTTWQLKLINATIPAGSNNIILPNYIQDILDSGDLDNGGYSMQVGTPYCWGGFDSYYTSNTTNCSNFVQAINAGNIAGNICSTSIDKVAGTCGLDCSGFVSAVYGFSYKLGTYNLYTDLNSVSSKSNLTSMDCLVKPSHHALLFSSWQDFDTGLMVIQECNTPSDYVHRCVIRGNKYFSDYVNDGYYLRSGW